MKMFKKNIYLITVLFILSRANVFAQNNSDDVSGVERYAIYIGSNIGGTGNQRLLYAGTDAISFQNTMADIGGIAKSNSLLLLDPTKDDVDNALNYVSSMITTRKQKSKRSEFIFYYSGHSDENALLLGKNVYNYSSLKAAISAVPSDVHVVILDSCYSGNFIRTKGGQRQKPFLVDDASVIKGHAYLSSSSSQESSQESDEIGSSFFTNAMITGLRGAADSSGDKKVTLNELYSYAFSETLSKTENTSTGPQHPNYNITLVGSGDLVLSDISNSNCMLTIAKTLSGRVIIRDRNDKLVSEINKSAASPVYLAMEEGKYAVTVVEENVTFQGSFELGAGKSYVLTLNSLTPVVRTATRSRGDDSETADSSCEDTENKAEESSSELFTEFVESENTMKVPFVFSFVCNEFYRGTEKDIVTTFALGLIRSDIYESEVAMISLIGNESSKSHGIMAAVIYNMTKRMSGIQGSGIFNLTEEMHGVQGAGFVNVAREVSGVQGSGIANVSVSHLSGVQGSGISNYAYSLNGVQGSGIINVTLKELNGVQGSGVTNYAGGIRGVQGSGVGNVVLGDTTGVQGAGVFNVTTGNVTGFQGSGCVNYAHSVKGLQVGLLNICTGDVEGLQLGLINISKNGVLEIGASVTTESDLRFTFNSGCKYLYTILGYSADMKCLDASVSSSEKYGHVLLGLGSRVDAGPVSFDFEAIGNEIIVNGPYAQIKKGDEHTFWYPSFRIGFDYSPVKHLQIFTGAMVSFESEGNNKAFERKTKNIVIETNNPNVKFHPEFDFGARFQFN